MKTTNCFEAAKYKNKWAVFDNRSRTFSFIGAGKWYCMKKAEELNKYCEHEEF